MTLKAYVLFYKLRTDGDLPENQIALNSDVVMSSNVGSSDRVDLLRSDDDDPA